MACLAFDFPPRFLAKSAEEALLFSTFPAEEDNIF